MSPTRHQIGDTRHSPRDLVMRYGWNATAYQILNPGIDHWFSTRHEAVIGYTTRHRVRVVVGAPVCSREDLPMVASEFEQTARNAGESVCYFCAERRLESLYRFSPAHSMVLLGAQPAWDPAGWEKIVAGHASIRKQLNRARNKGVRVEEWERERAHDNPELKRCLAEWLASRGLPSLHFMVEPETLDRLDDRRVFVATLSTEAIGFLVASPVPQRSGWLFEQFVRGRRAPNGTAESMIDAAMRTLASEGWEYITLGLSPLSRHAPTPETDNPLWLRLLLTWLRAHGRRFYNFGGLDAFKAKLQPDRWEPIFAISNEERFSAHTLYAIASAFSAGSPIGLVARAITKAIGTELKG